MLIALLGAVKACRLCSWYLPGGADDRVAHLSALSFLILAGPHLERWPDGLLEHWLLHKLRPFISAVSSMARDGAIDLAL